MRGIFEIVRARHSCRVPFNAKRCVSEQDLLQILEAARWAPTAQNMQNFEIIGLTTRRPWRRSPPFAPHRQTSSFGRTTPSFRFRKANCCKRRLGSLRACFQRHGEIRMQNRRMSPNWTIRFSKSPCRTARLYWSSSTTRGNGRQLPKGIRLECMSLGCVMQNIWLAAETLGIWHADFERFQRQGSGR